MYTNNREAYRQAFFTAWKKYQQKKVLEPIESELINIILLHPEYHPLLDHPEKIQHQEFTLEENPFFHMSLHLAICDQIRLNQPSGIKQIYERLIEKHLDPQAVEHQMMGVLADMIINSQQTGEIPSEQIYVEQLGKLE